MKSLILLSYFIHLYLSVLRLFSLWVNKDVNYSSASAYGVFTLTVFNIKVQGTLGST